MPHSDQHVSCDSPALFPLQRHPVVWNCWYQRLLLLGDGGITFELSPECPLNWNNRFTLHKLQHTKRFLLRSRHYRCVTSQTEREEGELDCAWAENLNACYSVPCGENLLVNAFSKPGWQIETARIILIHTVLDFGASWVTLRLYDWQAPGHQNRTKFKTFLRLPLWNDTNVSILWFSSLPTIKLQSSQLLSKKGWIPVNLLTPSGFFTFHQV